MKILKISRASVFFAIVTTLAITQSSCSKRNKIDTQMGTVVRQDLVQNVSASGVARGKRKSLITAGYSGYISKLHVSLGQKIKEGDPLVRIAQTVDQPLNQIFPIRSPFTGVVTQVLKTEGEYVESGSNLLNTIIRLDDLSEIWVDTDIPEIDIAKIKAKLEAQIRPNALNGKTYQGTVKEISLSAKESQDRWDRGKVEFPVQILLSNPDNDLKPGMSVVIDIITAKAEQVLTIPHEYLHRDGSQYFLIDHTGARHDVKTGLSNESIVEISEGAQENLRVQMINFSELGNPSQKTRSNRGRNNR